MKIKSCRFEKSSAKMSELPAPNKPEYAFIGRSNVGKSSLINMLTGQKSLAKTSAKPGKTQLINHFMINEQWYLVDLPGYGYAKVSKGKREDWEKMIRHYLTKRENLVCIFQLVDGRLSPQANDLEFANKLGEYGVPFVVVVTKTDKLGSSAIQANVAAYKKAMLEHWDDLPAFHLSSTVTEKGKEEILQFIEQCNVSYAANPPVIEPRPTV